MADTDNTNTEAGGGYQVLARKYRPQDFTSLIGQDAMVRTLSNAFKAGRVAHAFILTGVRGVGKTTTARIIAKALNCTGHDGEEPTIETCGTCDNCVAITAGRSVDVQEMDAASRTGIDDIREIIEGVRYGPVQGRFKVYIIDEVHMLSKAAFNGLLKTLEEPPPHVKFIFATTEIRKVPVTVLSRCQRFDLRRISASQIIGLMQDVSTKEGAKITEGALALIARAAEGSMRDALSLLDQAIAQGDAAEVDEAQVQDMLGVADRGKIFTLFESLMKGEAAAGLQQFEDLYSGGADALTVINDLLDVTHAVTRAKAVPGGDEDLSIPENERVQARKLADGLSMAVLGRAWQMLLKGADEVTRAARPKPAAEMVVIRLTHTADMPPPAELVERLQGGESVTVQTGPSQRGTDTGGGVPSAAQTGGVQSGGVQSGGPTMQTAGSHGAIGLAAQTPVPEAQISQEEAPQTFDSPQLERFEDLVDLADEKRDLLLKTRLETLVYPVKFSPGRLEIRLDEKATRSFPGELQKRLKEWTGQHWTVTVSNEDGAPSLAQKKQAKSAKDKADLEQHPMVQAVLSVFPDAEVTGVRPLGTIANDLDDNIKGEN